MVGRFPGSLQIIDSGGAAFARAETNREYPLNKHRPDAGSFALLCCMIPWI